MYGRRPVGEMNEGRSIRCVDSQGIFSVFVSTFIPASLFLSIARFNFARLSLWLFIAALPTVEQSD